MKTNFLSGIAMAFAAIMTVASCEENTPPKEVVFPEASEVEIAAGTDKDLTFTADADWTLTSDKTWCKFDDSGVETQTVSGTAGDVTVKVKVSGDGQDFDASDASLELTMDGKTQVVFTVTRPGIERFVKMYIKEGYGQNTTYTEAGKITITYDNGVASPEFGFVANFDWKVKSISDDGITFNEYAELTAGSANVAYDSEECEYGMLELSGALKTSVFGDRQIVISDLNGNNEFPFVIEYTGMGDAIELDGIGSGMSKGARFSADGFVMASEDPWSPPTVTEEKEFAFNVFAQENKYKTCVVEINENWYPEITESSWLTVNDTKDGNVKFTVTVNEGKEREAFFLVFPESQDLNTVKWEEYFDIEPGMDAFFKADNGFKVSQEGVAVAGGFTVQWSGSMEDVSDKLVPFSEYPNPMFEGMKPSEVGYSCSPDNNTYVYECTMAEAAGMLAFIPNGYPAGLLAHTLSREVDNMGVLPADFVLGQGMMYVNNDWMNTLNGVGIDLGFVGENDTNIMFMVDVFDSEEAMNLWRQAFASLFIVINPAPMQ